MPSIQMHAIGEATVQASPEIATLRLVINVTEPEIKDAERKVHEAGAKVESHLGAIRMMCRCSICSFNFDTCLAPSIPADKTDASKSSDKTMSDNHEKDEDSFEIIASRKDRKAKKKPVETALPAETVLVSFKQSQCNVSCTRTLLTTTMLADEVNAAYLDFCIPPRQKKHRRRRYSTKSDHDDDSADEDNEKQNVRYKSSTEYTIVVQDLKALPAVLSGLVAVEDSAIEEVIWTLKQATKTYHMMELRHMAAADAVQQAKDYCSGFGYDPASVKIVPTTIKGALDMIPSSDHMQPWPVSGPYDACWRACTRVEPKTDMRLSNAQGTVMIREVNLSAVPPALIEMKHTVDVDFDITTEAEPNDG